MIKLIPDFPQTVVSVSGICKNAGKTTLLNRIILESHGTLALTGIGLDGESIDQVTNTPKPNVFVKKDTVIYTAEKVLSSCDITKEILDVLPIHTALGRVVAVKALSDGNVILAGPSISAELQLLSNSFRKFGAEKLFVDGALSRRVFACCEASEAFMFCVGASYSPDMDKCIRDASFTLRIMTLPSPPKGTECLAFEGVLTDPIAMNLVRERKGVNILLDDAGKVMISQKTAELMERVGVKMFVRCPRKCLLVAVNPFSAYGYGFDGEKMGRAMRDAVPTGIPVVDCKSEMVF